MQVLKESYVRELNWERDTSPFQGALSFWHGLGHIFWWMRAFFAAQLGDGSMLQYETDYWSTRSI